MRKICFTVVAASAMLFSAQSMTAQEVAQANVTTEEAVVKAVDYVKIEISEVPAAVQQSLERDYEGAVLSEAFVKEEEGSKVYKLVVKTAEGEEQELFADAEGNWVEETEE